VQSVLVDAGPLIALADRTDKHHRRVASFLRRFKGRLLTTWPVLAEACHFLPERTQIAFLRWADVGGIEVVEMNHSAQHCTDSDSGVLHAGCTLADAQRG
jgi:uncharacterized protein